MSNATMTFLYCKPRPMRQEMSLRTPDPLCFSGGGGVWGRDDREMTALGRRKKHTRNFLQVHALVARERRTIEEHPLLILPASVAE